MNLAACVCGGWHPINKAGGLEVPADGEAHGLPDEAPASAVASMAAMLTASGLGWDEVAR